MEAPGQSVYRFLRYSPLPPIFSSIFPRFLTKKSMFFLMFFRYSSLVFFDMATFTIHRNLQVQMKFFIFSISYFLLKNDQKSSQKNTSKKIPKNDHLGTPLGPQNDHELNNPNPKITQMPPKNIFLRVPFFDVFLGC